MQEVSATVGAIEIFRKLLLATKIAAATQNRHLSDQLEEHFLKIDEDIEDILYAFQELESWKKEVFGEFEKKICLISDSSHSTLQFNHLIEWLRTEVHETKRKVGNYLPQLGFVWATRKRVQDGGMGDMSTEKMHLAQHKYNSMDEHLKPCFLCCSIFHSDCTIKRRGLINWWIGEGFVYPREGQTAQQVGEKCFEELLNLGLLEPVNKIRFNKKLAKSCKVNPSIRSLAISIAKQSQFLDFDSESDPTSWPSHRILRSSFISAQGSQNRVVSVVPPSYCNQLISLLNLNGETVKFNRDINYSLSKLTVLQLGQWRDFSKCHRVRVVNADAFMTFSLSPKNLRYLGMQGVYGINELPDSIDELTGLLVLDLRACHDLVRLPSAIGRLRKLTYLDISQCYMIDYLPSSIQGLENLEVLKGLVMGHSSHISTDQADLSHLVKLKMSRKLSMIFGVKSKISEDQLKDGKFLKELRVITLTWLTDSNSSREKLCPSMTLEWLPSSLEKLDLRCFPSKTTPTGLRFNNFTNLKRLYFRGGSMSSLNGLKTMQVGTLRLRYMESLYIDNMMKLQRLLPCIRRVEILDCPKIKGLSGLWIQYNGVWQRHAIKRSSNLGMPQDNLEVDNIPTERYRFFFLFQFNMKLISYDNNFQKLAERGPGFVQHFLFKRLLGILVFLYTCGISLVHVGQFGDDQSLSNNSHHVRTSCT